MNLQNEQGLRNQLVRHIRGGQAFTPIDKIIEKMPFEQAGIVPEGLPYSFYQQFYHIRFTQFDILDYCRNRDYQTPAWPDDYWPEKTAPDNEREWQKLAKTYAEERDAFCNYILDASNNLFSSFVQNPEHNLFREAQLVIEHTSYHTGQLFVIYRLLNHSS